MAVRISEADLLKQVLIINKMTGNPVDTYDSNGDINDGNYHLEYAFGGVRLLRIKANGGFTNPLNTGFIPKKELYQGLLFFIAGLEAAKKS